MEQEIKIPLDVQENAIEIKKNNGGRPKGKREYSACKVTLYLTNEEYELLTEFAKTAWWTFNYSGAARYLLINGLNGWVRKGKKKVY